MGIGKIGYIALSVTAMVCLSVATQAADPYHLRGEIESFDAGQLTLDTGEGNVSVSLNDDTLVFIVDKATIDDIKRDQFIGVTSIHSKGENVALEVHIFEESLRGLAAGHYPWDLVSEDNMMTNANIGKLVEKGDDRHITLSYVEGDPLERTVGTQTIVVPHGTVVVKFLASDQSKLVEGESVFLLAVDTEKGIVSPVIVVGQNGVAPPM